MRRAVLVWWFHRVVSEDFSEGAKAEAKLCKRAILGKIKEKNMLER